MGRASLRREARKWERIAEVMRDATDATRLSGLPGRAWAQVTRTVIGAIKDFQLQRIRALADRQSAIHPPGLE